MARRNDIDWEKVERLYIAGQLTIRQISEECGISDSSLRLKAKKNGWVRNLAEAIRERTKAKISQIDVKEIIEESAQQSAQQSAQTIKRAIEEASNAAANVRLLQRASIRDQIEQANSMQRILEKQIESLDGIGDILRATQALKNIIDSKLKLQEREDKIFGLAEDGENDGDEETVIIVNGVEVS